MGSRPSEDGFCRAAVSTPPCILELQPLCMSCEGVEEFYGVSEAVRVMAASAAWTRGCKDWCGTLMASPSHSSLLHWEEQSTFLWEGSPFSSISHPSSFVGPWWKKKAQLSVCVFLPHSTASPQGKETPYLVSSLLQQPGICLTTIKDCSTTRWRINSFCRRNEAWMDLVSWVWVWEDRGWVCCSGRCMR